QPEDLQDRHTDEYIAGPLAEIFVVLDRRPSSGHSFHQLVRVVSRFSCHDRGHCTKYDQGNAHRAHEGEPLDQWRNRQGPHNDPDKQQCHYKVDYLWVKHTDIGHTNSLVWFG